MYKRQVQEFVLSVGINMVAGYGLTESTATVACENDNDHVVGSVGRIMPQMCIRDRNTAMLTVSLLGMANLQVLFMSMMFNSSSLILTTGVL